MKVTYTMELMISVLKIRQANYHNLLKTSRESGVSRNTLRRWIDRYGSQAFKPDVNNREDKSRQAIPDRQEEIFVLRPGLPENLK